MDGSGIHQPGVFGFGMLPGHSWGGGTGLPPATNHGGLQQMHGSPGGYHAQNVHQPIGGGMDHQPHSPVGVNMGGVTSDMMDPLEAILGVFPCARLRGLPFEASTEDVLMFFQGLVVLDVIVLGRSDGKGSGEAFVVFANPMDFQMALQRDRQNMGRRYIEVFQGKRSEYYNAIIANHETSMNAANNHENGSNEGNEKTNNKNNQANGSGNGEKGWTDKGPTPAQAMALQGSGSSQGGSNGEGGGKGKGKGSGQGAKNSRNNFGGGTGNGGGVDAGKEHTGYLRLRGLPFSATKKDVLEFFKMYKPIESSVVFSYRSDGRATGEGYVSFDSPDDAKEAMALHRQVIGSRYIELFISSKEEHRRMVTRSNGR